MLEISSFFEKFKKLITNESLQRERAALIIGGVLSIQVDPKSIEIKNGAVKVNGSSVLRNEIHLKRQSILEKLKNDPSTAGIREVR